MRALIGTALVLATLASPASAQALVGVVSVVDADTVDMRGQRIRLFGIDGPEGAQSCEDGAGKPYPCGREAAFFLDGLIAGRPLSCEPRDVDRYERVVAVCSVGGVDLNGRMVSEGQAIAYTRYGRDYEEAERQARLSAKGIWRGRFEDPSEYRRSHPNPRR